MALYKRQGIYWCDFTIFGKRIRRSTKESNPNRAREFESTLIAQIKERQAVPESGRVPRLRDFSPRFLSWVEESRLDRDTKTYYKNGWRMLSATKLVGMRLLDITNDDVIALGPSAGSASNINNARRTLRRMLSKAVEWKVIRIAPKIALEEERGRELVFTPEQQAALLAVAEQPLKDVAILIFDSGMRPEEVFRIKWDNVLWDRGEIFVPNGKSEKARRFVPMSDRILDVLMTRKAKQEGEWVFPSKRAKQGHLTTVGKQFRAARKRLGLVKEYVLYSARHTFGTDLMQAAGNPKLVMKIMGHSQLSTTVRYVHPETQVVRDIINKRNAPPFGGKTASQITSQ